MSDGFRLQKLKCEESLRKANWRGTRKEVQKCSEMFIQPYKQFTSMWGRVKKHGRLFCEKHASKVVGRPSRMEEHSRRPQDLEVFTPCLTSALYGLVAQEGSISL